METKKSISWMNNKFHELDVEKVKCSSMNFRRKRFNRPRSRLGFSTSRRRYFLLNFLPEFNKMHDYPNSRNYVIKWTVLSCLKLGTTVNFSLVETKIKKYILVFSDADRTCDNGKMYHIAVLIFGSFKRGQFFTRWNVHYIKKSHQ